MGTINAASFHAFSAYGAYRISLTAAPSARPRRPSALSQTHFPVSEKEQLDFGNARRGSILDYSPITAADEKIPLSLVRVNIKPQYLVLSFHFEHPASKLGFLPVESPKSPCLTRGLDIEIA